ncbi:MAG: peptidyl-prolyl cis-trans isomerase [Chthoniobacterales bacterium]
MITILRKNQKGLWIVIAVLCIPFVFYFTNSRVGPIGRNDFGKIYGHSIPSVEFQRNARLFNLARNLGMFAFLQDMVGGAANENEAYAEFTWNRLILRHEADRLGIAPSSQQIATVVKAMRPFRGANGFEIEKYNEFTQNVLPTLGFSDAQIEELAGDQLMLEKVKDLLGTGVQIPASESKENFERAYGKMDVAVVRFRSDDLAKEIKIGDDEVAKYFETHGGDLKTEEKRKVSLMSFALSDEQKKLAGKERVEVLQRLADKANDFNQALLEKGGQFDQVAAKFQTPIQTTGEFTQSAPDPLLKGNAQLTPAAFALTAEEPNSDALQVADGFFVLHLDATEPAKPLTFAEATPKILEKLKAERLQELLSTKGAEAAQKIRDAMKTGVSAEAAIQQAGLVAEKITPFSLAESAAPKPKPDQSPAPETPDLSAIKSAVAELSSGEVSQMIPTATGGLVAVLEKREAPHAATNDAAKMLLDGRYLNSKREIVFYEWLRERRREAGVLPTAG